MKKFLNDPARFVDESVRAFGLAHSDILGVNADPLYVVRNDAPVAGRVGVISGGGSGHEPMHAGFVGEGMLDAAVPGPVFTSPSPDPIEAASRAVDSGAGVLHIVKNYTGDVLNFETAAELADDVEITTVLVNDDVAVEDSLYTAGRRGVAGTILVEKIAGAAAARGDDLAGVTALAQRAADNVRSMGLALDSPVSPSTGEHSFDLGDDEVEIGIGIHGEPGRRRIPMTTSDELTDQLTDPVVEDLGLTGGEKVVLLVNGMGATPDSELYLIYGRARARLEEKGVEVVRSKVGSYVTSLDMAGASVTVLKVDDELLALYDAPARTVAWTQG
ncbi:dihydroxyacetone kinase subunit DhaK [Georgenia sp. Z1491]|uniref:dihydroxyacetone kinase subunit DhaK n=1 Tax=Georgenia sp. Z1491 TaxID=3416707 RepID=UPI003CE7EB08